MGNWSAFPRLQIHITGPHLCNLLTGGVSYLLMGGGYALRGSRPLGVAVCAKPAAVVALVQALAGVCAAMHKTWGGKSAYITYLFDL